MRLFLVESNMLLSARNNQWPIRGFESRCEALDGQFDYKRLLLADLRQPNTPNYPVLSVRYGIDSGYTF